jgi:hypothetical protein
MVTTTLSLVAFLYTKASTMPDTIPTPELHPTPSNAFFARVLARMRRHEARTELAERRTGQPYRYPRR